MNRKQKRPNKTIGPVCIWTILLIILLLMPTGFEGAKTYKNAERVRAEVLEIDDSDIINTGLVRAGEQRCKVKILDGNLGDPVDIALAISRKTKIPNLTKRINKSLAKLRADGTFDRL